MHSKNSRRALMITAALPFLVLAGCSGDTTGPETRREVAVFGYLFTGETVSEGNAIHVSETRPINESYDPAEAAIDDAVVILQKSGEAPDTLAHVGPGAYADPDLVIAPRTTYDLRVEIPGHETVSATTTTPSGFVAHREPRVLPGTMRLPAIPDSFAIAIACDDPDQMLLLDVYCEENWRDAVYVNQVGDRRRPSDYEEYGRANGEPRHISAYFRLENLKKEGEDRVIDFYDAMMVFYGRYTVTCLAMDDNYYNHLYRDHPEENGGIRGGIGVFGSACRKQYRVEVTP